MKATDIFKTGIKTILSMQESHYPVRFHPWVQACEDRQIALNLPEQWSRLADLFPGMSVDLSTVREECIFTLHGEIKTVDHIRHPSLIVAHDNRVHRTQRRAFFRIETKLPLMISCATLPEGRELSPFPAKLVDISAGGIGFLSGQFIPPGTLFRVSRLFDPLIQLKEPEEGYRLESKWCRVQRPEGFHGGASFIFTGAHELEQVAKVVNQLQVVKLSRFYRVLGK